MTDVMAKWRASQMEKLHETIERNKPRVVRDAAKRVAEFRSTVDDEAHKAEMAARDTAKNLKLSNLVTGEYDGAWPDSITLMFNRGQADAYEAMVNWLDQAERTPRAVALHVGVQTDNAKARQKAIKQELIDDPSKRGLIEEIVEGDAKISALEEMAAWIQGYAGNYAFITHKRCLARLAQHEKKAQRS